MTITTTDGKPATVTVEALLAGAQPELPLELIHIPEDRVRTDLGDLDDITEDVRKRGVRSPVEVRPRSADPADGVWLVAGERRLEAAKRAGLTTVPVTLSREETPAGNLLDELLENLLRQDMHPSEEGRGFKRLQDEFAMTQPQIAKAVKRSQSHVSKRIKLARQPAEVQKLVDDGQLTLEAVEHLDKIRKMPVQVRNDVLDRVSAGAGVLTAAEIEDLVEERIAEHKRQKTRERLRRDLERAGVTILDWPEAGFDVPSGERFLIGQEHACVPWLTIETDAAEHAEQPCHAGVICPHDQVSYLCTDPDSHRQRPTLTVVPEDPAEPEPAAGEGDVEPDGEQEAEAATVDHDASAVQDDAAADAAQGDQPQQPETATAAEAAGQATAEPAPEPAAEPDPQEAARIEAERAEAERRRAEERARIEEERRKAEEEKRLRREKRRAHVEALAAAELERTAFIADFLAKLRISKAKRRTSKDELIDLQTRQMLNGASSYVLELACTWLEVEVPPGAFGGSDYWGGLDQSLNANPEQAERVGWALAFATGEAVLRGSAPDWTGPKTHTHLNGLKELGREPTDAEAAEMEGLAPSSIG